MEEANDNFNWLGLPSSTATESPNSLPFMMIPVQTRVDASNLPPLKENVDYYEEYCRIYMQAVSLTTQVQSLLSEKADLSKRMTTMLNDSKESQEASGKRQRRKATQIERHFKCEFCSKSYGAEGSLNQHVRLKHPKPDS